jgi:hypothetical protein
MINRAISPVSTQEQWKPRVSNQLEVGRRARPSTGTISLAGRLMAGQSILFRGLAVFSMCGESASIPLLENLLDGGLGVEIR